MKHLLTGIFLLLAPLAWAQTDRQTTGTALQPEVQAEFGLDGRGDYVLLGLRGFRALDYGYSNPAGRFGFDERQLRLGYEHFWNERWSGGATARLAGFGYGTEFVPELLLRHRAALGPVVFGQRLSIERTFPDNRNYVGGPGPAGKNFVRLRLDVEKQLPVGTLTLRPRLSYELAAQFRLQKEDTDPRLRAFSDGGLRGEVGLRLGRAFDVTPWFAYRTDYIAALPQYNSMGQQVRGGDLNLITPIVGLDVRFTLVPESANAERIQLPTQH